MHIFTFSLPLCHPPLKPTLALPLAESRQLRTQGAQPFYHLDSMYLPSRPDSLLPPMIMLNYSFRLTILKDSLVTPQSLVLNALPSISLEFQI